MGVLLLHKEHKDFGHTEHKVVDCLEDGAPVVLGLGVIQCSGLIVQPIVSICRG